MRIGSLCAGYGGLEEGVRSVLGGQVAWQSEIDPGACKILAHRYPGVPNIGDMTAINWADVEPVDVLCSGTPCQDLSAAGKRAGMTEGTRSNLWVAMREATAQLRPSLVVWENVRGAYSARADSELESREGRVGVGGDGPVLRALGRVLGDLSSLGYDAAWHGLRAADVGAPHGRFRVFVIAWPADTKGDTGRLGDRNGRSVADAADHDGDRRAAAGAAGRRSGSTTADADSLGHERSRRTRDGRPRPADSPVATAHPDGSGLEGGERPESQHAGSAVAGLPTAPHPEGHGRHEGRPEPARIVGGSDAAQRSHGPVGPDGRCLCCRLAPEFCMRRPEGEWGQPLAPHAHGDTLREQPVALAGRSGAAVAGHPGADAAANADDAADNRERSRAESRNRGQVAPDPTAGDAKASRNSTATRHRLPPTGIHAGDTLTDALVPKEAI